MLRRSLIPSSIFTVRDGTGGLRVHRRPWRMPYHHNGLPAYCRRLGVQLEPFQQLNYDAFLHSTNGFGSKPQRARRKDRLPGPRLRATGQGRARWFSRSQANGTSANFAFQNFEMAAYKSLITVAEHGGYAGAVQGLAANLREEQLMAAWLDENIAAVTTKFGSLMERGDSAKI